MEIDNRMAWWKDAAERLLWTFLQGALAIMTAQQFGWVELGSGEWWKAAALGGLASAMSLGKSLFAAQLSPGDTAQLGAHTYSYTATGPGAAGGDLVEEGE